MRAADARLDDYLQELRAIVNDALARAWPTSEVPAPAHAPMAYALTGGGKRLRPCLTLAVADAVAPHQPLGVADARLMPLGVADARLMPLGVADARLMPLGVADARLMALPAACAVEMIHSYSLVHDDLPAMDDDPLRRGRPTTHVVFGDGLAILAGDGLLTEAFVVLSSESPPVVPAGSPAPDPDRRLRMVHRLATAAGAIGMVGGQAIDLVAAGRTIGVAAAPLDATALEDMHARKTGALIRAAAALGAIAVGAHDATLAAIDDYARELGLAFQIVDDVLDVEESSAALGKTSGKDAAAGKPTYPARYGIAGSRARAADCVARATAALDRAGVGGRLKDIAAWSLERRH